MYWILYIAMIYHSSMLFVYALEKVAQYRNSLLFSLIINLILYYYYYYVTYNADNSIYRIKKYFANAEYALFFVFSRCVLFTQSLLPFLLPGLFTRETLFTSWLAISPWYHNSIGNGNITHCALNLFERNEHSCTSDYYLIHYLIATFNEIISFLSTKLYISSKISKICIRYHYIRET